MSGIIGAHKLLETDFKFGSLRLRVFFCALGLRA